MTILKELARSLAIFIAFLGLVAGLFLIVVGIINGFGNPTWSSRILVVTVGLVLDALCLYIQYLLNGRSWEKLIDSILDGILFNYFR